MRFTWLPTVFVWFACGGVSPPMLANTALRAQGCPPASAVFGPAQETAANTWTLPLGVGSRRIPSTEPALKLGLDRAHEFDGASLPPGRTWLVREAAAPCAVRVVKVDKMGLCDGDPCTFQIVMYDAVLAGNCEAPSARDRDHQQRPEMADDAYPPVVVSDGPPACRLSRPVEIPHEAIVHADLPEPVRLALDAASAQPSHEAWLNVTSAGQIPVIWQVGSFYFEPVTTARANFPENCPMSIWVFVRTPSGVVQLDTQEGVIGLLADAHGPAVVLTGGLSGIPKNRAFDVAHLPPHRSTARSWSSETCSLMIGPPS